MKFLKTFQACEPFVRIAKFESNRLCYLKTPIKRALKVYTRADYFSTICMLNSLIHAKDELEYFPYDSLVVCGMTLYRVSFKKRTVYLTTVDGLLIIVLSL